MHLDERAHAEIDRLGLQRFEGRRCERGDDQQDRVGARRVGLEHLVGVSGA